MAIQYKQAPAALQLKAGSDGYGRLSGYAAVFNNIDQVGDIILPGAFTKGLDTFRREGYLAIGHEHAALPVGTIDVAQEDMRGLWIESDLHGTAAAQELRGVAQARISKGKSLGLSIGFIIPAGGYEFRDDGVRLLKEIDLREVSVTPSPANREALISGVKQALADLDLDGKEGRAISQDRRARLAAIRDALATLKDLQGELDDLLAETEPPGGAGGGSGNGGGGNGKGLTDAQLDRIYIRLMQHKHQLVPGAGEDFGRFYLRRFYARKHQLDIH